MNPIAAPALDDKTETLAVRLVGAEHVAWFDVQLRDHHYLGAALRSLPAQWSERFGYRPLLAESFTDPEAYSGTCYKASNWQAVGMSAGYSRHRADFYLANEHPKKNSGPSPGSRRKRRPPFFDQTCNGHGRTEQRRLRTFPIEPSSVGFAGARSIIMVRSEVYTRKTDQTTHDTRYYLSSQEPKERTPGQWQQLIRGHWAGVEIRNHWRRDSLWGEDRSRTRKPRALANLALLRSALLALIPVHFPNLPLKQVFELFTSNPSSALRVLR